MRAAIGVLLLFIIFFAAVLMQDRWAKEVRENRPGLLIQPERAANVAEETELGWARLTVGRPSGASPIDAPSAPRGQRTMIEASGGLSERADPTSNPAPGESATPERPADWIMTIRSNQTLSQICQEFYGTAAPKVYTKLAEYNGLDGPDDLRLGQRIHLPPTKELLLDGE